MGGIAVVSPGNIVEEKLEIKRSTKCSTLKKEHFIPIIEPFKSVKNLPEPNTKLKPLPSSTCLWMHLSREHCLSKVYNTPNWGGFMSKIFCSKMDESIKCRVLILPFTLGLPSDLTTVFSDLLYAGKVNNMKTLFVTFDQPLYIKARKIVHYFPDLFKDCLMKLGEFHLIMSYLGCIGYIMSGSGLNDLWSTVYAECSIVHMLSGHAYSTSLSAHLSTMVALFHCLQKKCSHLQGIDFEPVKT